MSVPRIRVIKVELLKHRLERLPKKLNLDLVVWGNLCRFILPELYGRTRKKPAPTRAQPGSAERVALYIKRQQRGEEIFSDNDWVPTHRTL